MCVRLGTRPHCRAVVRAADGVGQGHRPPDHTPKHYHVSNQEAVTQTMDLPVDTTRV